MMSDKEFETIREAVMATAHGRWFLAEYARRIRAGETDKILLALSDLSDRISSPAVTHTDPLKAAPKDPFAIALADIDALPLTERLKLTG
jgi:hypothetical protein